MHLRTVAVEGRRVKLHDLGEGPPVVMLHGLLGSPAYLLPLAQVLARHRRVLVPQLPGHRGSDPLRRFSFAAMVDHLHAGMQMLDVERPALLGHSFGAPLAVHWAARHPVRSLVAASPVGVVPLELGVARWALPISGAVATLATLAAGPASRSFAGRRLVFGWFVGMARPQAVDPAMGEMLIRGAARSQSAVADVLPALDGLDVRPAAAQVDCPSLVVWGNLDKHRRNGPPLAAALRGQTAVLPGCGHMPSLEAPFAFAVAVRPVL